METTLRTLGPAEAKVVLSFREQGRDVVETGDIIGLLASEQTGRKVIRNLVRKGWLTRLGGGRYMLLPPEWGPETIGENNPLAVASAVVKESLHRMVVRRRFSRVHHAKTGHRLRCGQAANTGAHDRGSGNPFCERRAAQVFRVKALHRLRAQHTYF